MAIEREIENLSYEKLETVRASVLLFLREIESAEKSLPESSAFGNGISFAEKVRRFEVNLIRHALVQTQGRQRRAAKILGMKISTLNAKIKRYEIDALNLGNFSADRV